MFDTLLDQELVSVQSFEVKANSKVWVVAKKGFKVFVDHDKLCKKDGSPVTGKIVVKIKEVTTPDEMIAANTPTMSDDKMLVSGGSYFLQFNNDGEALKLKPNQKLQVQLPNFKKNGMQLFYGDSTATGLINWRTANTKFLERNSISQPYTKIIERDYYTDQKKIGDSIGKRPATFEECYKIYKDSVFKARCAYTIANRSKLTYKQEMAYILQPIVFPSKRFYSLASRYDSFAGCIMSNSGAAITSKMYFVTDTFPVYKEMDVKIVREVNKAEETLNYYEPMEINSLGWINCDKFNDAPISNRTEFMLKNTESLTMCRIYYKFKKMNSVLAEQLYLKNEPKKQFTSTLRLTIGEAVEVIIVGVKKGKVFIDKKSQVVANDNKWVVDLKQVSKGKI